MSHSNSVNYSVLEQCRNDRGWERLLYNSGKIDLVSEYVDQDAHLGRVPERSQAVQRIAHGLRSELLAAAVHLEQHGERA